MTKQMLRVIGYLLYRMEQITSRSCNCCAIFGTEESFEICKYCKPKIGKYCKKIVKPDWKEDKSNSLEDMMTECEVFIGGKYENNYPWENFLTSEAKAVLEKVEKSGV